MSLFDQRLSVKVTPTSYSSLIPLLDNRLLVAVWESRKITDVLTLSIWSEYRNVVYIVVDSDSLAVYVGSTNRTIGERLSEHIKIENRQNWDRVYILPLKDGLDEATLRKFEGLVGRRLRPYGNSKLPS